MKLSKLTEAINNYDRAEAATSYGYGNPSFMAHIYRLLPFDTQMKLLKAAVEYSKEYLKASEEELERLGIVIDTKDPAGRRLEENAKAFERMHEKAKTLLKE